MTRDFPVLSGGRTPHTPLAEWDFSIVDEVGKPRRWTWDEFRALPSEDVTVDIHCVTKWSNLDTAWQRVSVDTLLDEIETSAEYVVQCCDPGYTTKVSLEDLTGGKAWVTFAYDGEPIEPEHGGPARMLVPPPVLLEERQVGARAAAPGDGPPGLPGDERLSQLRRSMAGAALLGRLNWRVARVVHVVTEMPWVKAITFDVPGWPGHRAGQHVDVRLTAEYGYQAQRSYSVASAPGAARVAHGRASR